MEALLEWDANALLWIQENLRNDVLTAVMKCITRLGDNGTIWIALAVLLMVLPKNRKAGVASAISLLLTLLVVNVGIKNIVARVRPYEAIEGLTRLVPPESSFSFPSGHAAHAFAVGVVVLIMLPKKAGIPLFSLSVLVSLSRMYVGVHYPTDVVCGAIIGTAMALISVFIVNEIIEKFNKRDEKLEIRETLEHMAEEQNIH